MQGQPWKKVALELLVADDNPRAGPSAGQIVSDRGSGFGK
jgi:hypothetical protein